MSLEGLLKELDRKRRDEQDRMISLMREQSEAMIRAKDQEIASLRDEILTLRSWLDHSALPAANPISRRSDSMGLIKMNFGKDKPCPDMFSPGERELLESVRKEEVPCSSHDASPFPEESQPLFAFRDAPGLKSPSDEKQGMPFAPVPPEREPSGNAGGGLPGFSLGKSSHETVSKPHQDAPGMFPDRPAASGLGDAAAKKRKAVGARKKKPAPSAKKPARKR